MLNALTMNKPHDLDLSGTSEGAMKGWVSRRGGSTSFKAEHASNYAHASSSDADQSGSAHDHKTAQIMHEHAQKLHAHAADVARAHGHGDIAAEHDAAEKSHGKLAAHHAGAQEKIAAKNPYPGRTF